MISKFGPTGLRFSATGRPAVSTDVLVVLRGTDTEAPLFSDKDGTPADNPTRTDPFGNLSFWASPGLYDLLINGARISVEVESNSGGGDGGAYDGLYRHDQLAPSASWIIQHNLGVARNPVILLDDDPTVQVLTDVHHSPGNLVTTIDFPAPVTGRAYL